MRNPTAGEGDDAASPHRTDGAPFSRRRFLAAASATAGASALAGCMASLPPVGGSGTPTAYDGVDVTWETAWVETPVDTDDSGTPDRVFGRVARPSAADDDPVPGIATASPYLGEQTHGDTTPEMFYDRAVAPAARTDGNGNAPGGSDATGSACASSSRSRRPTTSSTPGRGSESWSTPATAPTRCTRPGIAR